MKITCQCDIWQIVDVKIVDRQRILQPNRRFTHLNLRNVTISLVEYYAHETRLAAHEDATKETIGVIKINTINMTPHRHCTYHPDV